jgi:hypothetical protein
MAFMMDLSTTCKPGTRAGKVGRVSKQNGQSKVGVR